MGIFDALRTGKATAELVIVCAFRLAPSSDGAWCPDLSSVSIIDYGFAEGPGKPIDARRPPDNLAFPSVDYDRLVVERSQQTTHRLELELRERHAYDVLRRGDLPLTGLHVSLLLDEGSAAALDRYVRGWKCLDRELSLPGQIDTPRLVFRLPVRRFALLARRGSLDGPDVGKLAVIERASLPSLKVQLCCNESGEANAPVDGLVLSPRLWPSLNL